MSETITLDIPSPVIEQARALAERTQRRIEDVLLDWLDRSAAETPMELLSDEQVLALAASQLSDEQQEQLEELLAAQRESRLDADQQGQLDHLMQLYRRGWVRKAQAHKIAVERGLLPPQK